MSAALQSVPDGAGAPARGRVAGRLTAVGIVRSEVQKLLSLRSVVLTLVFAAVGMVGMSLFSVADVGPQWEGGRTAPSTFLTPAQASLNGWLLAQFFVGAVGALAVTTEYASGSTVATLAAVPRRLGVFRAKLLVVAAATFAVALPAAVLGVVLGPLVLADDVHLGLGDPGVARAVLAAAVGLSTIAVLGAAAGFLVRSSAGAIGIVVALFLVLPTLVGPFSTTASAWVPSGAVEALLTVERGRGDVPIVAWPVGALLLVGYVGAAVLAARVALLRRDA